MSVIVPILVAGFFVVGLRWSFSKPIFFGCTYQEYNKRNGLEYAD